MSTQYIISCVDDFFEIPLDKLPLCLIELGTAIAIMHKAKKPGEPLIKDFVWIDDGAHSVKAQDPSGQEMELCDDWTKLFPETKSP